MRLMVTVTFPTDPGNEFVRAGRVERVIGRFMEEMKPEAAYFYADQGDRAGTFIVDIQDASQIAGIGERLWFGLGGKVKAVPVMTPEDLQKGLANISTIVQNYA